MPSTQTRQPITESLEGLTIRNGLYKISEKVSATSPREQRARTVCYRATEQKSDQDVFIKAIDFRHEEAAGDTEWLEAMLRQYNNEKSIARLCRSRSLSRVTRIIEDFKEQIQGETIHFLVFQHAGIDCSAIDTQLEACKVLHGITAAMRQLHSQRIAHHDPVFRNVMREETGKIMLSDLGSATCLHFPTPPHDERGIIGSVDVAPPEALYGYFDPELKTRHFSYDLYCLGALLYRVFCIAHHPPLNVLYLAQCLLLPKEKSHENWGDDYDQVIPSLRAALVDVVSEYIEGPNKEIEEDVKKAVLTLCDPDPKERGHGFYRLNGSSPYDLQRWVSFFDRLYLRIKMEANRARVSDYS